MKEENYELQFELFQPWSTFVMKTQLPSPILEKMLKITDKIIANSKPMHGAAGAGQIEDDFNLDNEILEREGLMEFFLDVVRQFVIKQTIQVTLTEEKRKEIAEDKWYTQMIGMWINSQKDNEYQPLHFHPNADVSTVMYLKIPEYLPSRNPNQNEDGAITFINAGAGWLWGTPSVTILPAVGDFFIFPAAQLHQVYPFRTADGKGERRSAAFNAVFTSKSLLEKEKYKYGEGARIEKK